MFPKEMKYNLNQAVHLSEAMSKDTCTDIMQSLNMILCEQRSLWSDCTSVQSDQGLPVCKWYTVGFPMTGLIHLISQKNLQWSQEIGCRNHSSLFFYQKIEYFWKTVNFYMFHRSKNRHLTKIYWPEFKIACKWNISYSTIFFNYLTERPWAKGVRAKYQCGTAQL